VYLYDRELAAAGIDLFPRSGAPLTSWLEKFDQYSLDQHIIHLLRLSDMVTDDPNEAQLFVVPLYATHETHYCAFNEHNASIGMDIVKCAEYVTRTLCDPVMRVVTASPFFQRHNGSDHILTFPWDWGYWLFDRGTREFAQWLQHSKIIVVQYLATPGFPSSRVVIAPVVTSKSMAPATIMQNLLRQSHPGSVPLVGPDGNVRSGPPGSSCDRVPPALLATFRGTIWPDRGYSAGIRQDLLALYGGAGKSKSRIIVSAGHTTPEEYLRELTDTSFCLSPPGSSAWSQRFYDLIAAGCPLVLYNAESKGAPALAFSSLIDWNDFSIIIDTGQQNFTAAILEAIPRERVCAMRRAVTQAAQFLLFSTSPMNVVSLIMAEALAKSQVLKDEAGLGV
jgi:hypothetical protein